MTCTVVRAELGDVTDVVPVHEDRDFTDHLRVGRSMAKMVASAATWAR